MTRPPEAQNTKRLILFGVVSMLVLGCQTAPEEVNTLNSRYTDEQPSLSGNGQFVAFVSSRGGRSQILLYDLRNRNFVQVRGITAGATQPSLSRNARYIAYVASNQGRSDIFIYDRATQRPEIVSWGYANSIRHPRISPDGRYIVFESDRRGQWDIEVLDRGAGIELDRPEGQ